MSEIRNDVAIIGLAGRFPGASNANEFWSNLCRGVESISRFSASELRVPNAASLSQDPNYVMARAIIPDADTFDAAFFGIYPKEAELIDPQQRVFLECCWHAFEDAGYDPLTYPGKVGVYAGCSFNTYFLEALCADPAFIHEYSSGYQVSNFNALLGTNFEFLASRVAYKLNLKGPAFSMNSGCSTSLLAIANACLAVQTYQCDMVLAGGVSITFPQKRGYFHEPGGMVSPDGFCRTFDAQAQGTVFGDGAGVVLLRRLEDAIDAGDNIYAVIRGFGINNDGSQKVGFTAPGVDGQAEAIAAAHAAAEVDPESITYVEAHGTATPLGDPIELAALTKAFRRGTQKRGFCAIGTAKTNLGHLDVAAGVTGLIKTALSLHHRMLPPVIHFNRPNPDLKLETSPFFVNTSLTDWKHSGPLRAGVSAFGIGGTNAHAILEQAPGSSSRSSIKSEHLVVLSAKSQDALSGSTKNLVEYLRSHPGSELSDVAFTLMAGRHPFEVRTAVVGSTPAEIVEALGERTTYGASRASCFQAAFMFPGQGSQHVNMGRQLYHAYPQFRERIDECCEILKGELGFDLRSAIFQSHPNGSDFSRRINNTAIAQPALFAIEYSLARLWMSLGIQPASMIGHSVGEYVAACLAGVLSIEDALGLIAFRGRLMQELPEGRMLAVRADRETVSPMLGECLSIAAINSPSLMVLSGPTVAIDQVQSRLSEAGVPFSQLHTSHAFHSQMMEPIRDRFVERVGRLSLRAPSIPYVSGVTGDWITADEVARPEYWFDHLRKPVLFSDGFLKLRCDGITLLEVGPGRTLSTLAKQHRTANPQLSIVSSLPDAVGGESEERSMLSALGRLWSAGATVDWSQLYLGERRSRVALPGYPFERKRFWFEAKGSNVPAPKAVNRVAISMEVATGAAFQVEDSAATVKVDQSTAGTNHSNTRPDNHMSDETSNNDQRELRIRQELVGIFEDLSGVNIAGEGESTTFLELGFDSLFLTQVSQSLQSKYGIKITFRQLLDQHPSLLALASHLNQKLPPEIVVDRSAVSATASDSAPVVEQARPGGPAQANDRIEQPTAVVELPGPSGPASSAIESVFREQLRAMSDLAAKQIEFLRTNGSHASLQGEATTGGQVKLPTQVSVQPAIPHTTTLSAPKAPQAAPKFEQHGRYKPIITGTTGDLSNRQEAALNQFIERYNTKTAGSKKLTQEHRSRLADPRVVAGFRVQWKELVYPIVTVRSKGSKIWDVDGNEYVDVVNGFGPIFFGHAPDFVTRAVAQQLEQGFETGPQSPLAGEVAELICELTGMERATFCNTGSEAVMAAIRVSRTITGRQKIVLFANSYHGMFDEVLVKGIRGSGGPRSVPIAPGIPREKTENVVVLDYGSDEALAYIRAHCNELAAILVEPVQSRHPALQPIEFLKEVRRITEAAGTALVFDEVVTGFRVHPGGAQAIFGIRADLATYGKVIGGGLPIGVLAGKATFMDALDGGAWQYGDDSYPETGVTFFAGTFVRHPLALAAARAVLKHVKSSGPDLQLSVSAKTQKMVSELNAFLEERQAPTHIESFASTAYFSFPSELRFASLFYYYMREKGIHIQESFPMFLTTEHSSDDFERIVAAFKQSVVEMQEAGFLPGRSTGEPASDTTKAGYDSTKPAGLVNGLDHNVLESMAGLSPASSDTHGLADSATSARRAPLTESQTEIWLSAKLSDEASCAYNESFMLKLKGALKVAALLGALDLVIARHDALRTTFDSNGEFQEFAPRLKIEVPTEELSGMSQAEQAKRIEELIEEDARLPFDLTGGPLIRAKLLRLADDNHHFMVTTHHIVCDGWSTNVMLDELSKLYTGLVGGTPAELPVPIQFETYAEREAQNQDRSVEEYWLGVFKDPAGPLDLPSDRPRPAHKSFKGATCRRTIDARGYQDIKRAGAKQKCTLFATLLAGFHALLARLSDQNDIVVGIPAAGQSLVDGDNLIGHCVNFLPLRARFDHSISVAELLAQVKQTVLDAYEHQTYTYGTLVRKLDLPRDPGRLPLLEIQFNLERVGGKASFGSLTAEVDSNPKSFVNFDLFLNVVESDAGLVLDCDYNSELFDEATIARWLGHYQTLLESFAREASRPVEVLDLLNDTERKRILVDWNSTACEYRPALVHQLFEERVQESPDAIAVQFADAKLTYAELDRAANRLANYLIKSGVRPRSLVGVYLERSERMLVALLAIMKTGAAYVPLDPIYPAERIEFILRDSSVSTLLTESALLGSLAETDARSLCIDTQQDKIASQSDTPPKVDAKQDDLAYTIYTSGSTGRPKGVEVCHRGVVNLLLSMSRDPGFKATDAMLAVTTLAFDIAGLELFLPLISGGRVIIASREAAANGNLLLDEIRRSRANVMQATPTTWRMLLEAGWSGDPALKILCGGEALSRDLARDLIEVGTTVHNMYGPTETTIWSSVAAIGGADARVVVGGPIANTQFYVLDKSGQPSPIGVPGELYIAGDGLARGYHARHELTTEKFVVSAFSEPAAPKKMFRTGDLVRWLPDGTLEFFGRLDNQIKLRGYRIELGEIESLLVQYRGIKEAAVALSGSGDPRLIAYVVLAAGAPEPKFSEIRAFLRQRLPEYMVPSAVVTLPAMPRTPNGKLDRKSLPTSDSTKPASEYVAPSTDCERTLCEIWAQVMGKDRVGITDDIFELGGDSIRIFRIAARARQAGLPLDGMHMFKHRTIGELAKMLSQPESRTVRERLPTGPAARAARRLISR